MYTQQQSILGAITNDELDKHAIIKPPEIPYVDTRYTRLVIDSMNRNTDIYANPNDYYFVFDDDVNDVVSAKLVSIDIPFSTYTINMHFNTLWVTVGAGAETAVSLTQGLYEKTALATMMQNSLNSAFPSASFTVTYDSLLDKYRFSANTSFSLNFKGKSNSLDPLLGFAKKLYTSTGNAITAPFRCNLNYNNYIIMCIDQFDNNKSNAKPLNKSFAVFSKDYNLSVGDEPNIIKKFSPPLARLAKLHLTFYDRFGNLYDFQNMDHRIELLLQSFKQRGKYNNIFGTDRKQN